MITLCDMLPGALLYQESTRALVMVVHRRATNDPLVALFDVMLLHDPRYDDGDELNFIVFPVDLRYVHDTKWELVSPGIGSP